MQTLTVGGLSLRAYEQPKKLMKKYLALSLCIGSLGPLFTCELRCILFNINYGLIYVNQFEWHSGIYDAYGEMASSDIPVTCARLRLFVRNELIKACM